MAETVEESLVSGHLTLMTLGRNLGLRELEVSEVRGETENSDNVVPPSIEVVLKLYVR